MTTHVYRRPHFYGAVRPLAVVLRLQGDVGPVQVAASADDGHEDAGGTGFNASGDTVRFDSQLNVALRRTGFFRFDNIAIPKDATIDRVDLALYVLDSSGAFTARVFCELADDTVDLTSNADIIDRTKTDASVSWGGVDLDGYGWQTTTDPKAAVEEVVALAGWSSGNAIAFLIEGEADWNGYGIARSYDYDPSLAARLTVWYTESAGTTISCTLGTIDIVGLQSSISAGTTIGCALGTIAIAGLQADVQTGTVISCTLGTVAITGLAASISAATTVNCTLGTIEIAGLAATIEAGGVINCTLGTVEITGLPATISAATTIACTLGTVEIAGLAATVSAGTTIACTLGTLEIAGLAATIGAATAIDCTLGTIEIAGLAATISTGLGNWIGVVADEVFIPGAKTYEVFTPGLKTIEVR